MVIVIAYNIYRWQLSQCGCYSHSFWHCGLFTTHFSQDTQQIIIWYTNILKDEIKFIQCAQNYDFIWNFLITMRKKRAINSMRGPSRYNMYGKQKDCHKHQIFPFVCIWVSSKSLSRVQNHDTLLCNLSHRRNKYTYVTYELTKMICHAELRDSFEFSTFQLSFAMHNRCYTLLLYSEGEKRLWFSGCPTCLRIVHDYPTQFIVLDYYWQICWMA